MNTGSLFVVLLFLGLAVYFLVRAAQVEQRSARLANLALFLGLLVFVNPEPVLGFAAVGRSVLQWVGVGRLAAGLLGIVLAVLALWYRRQDRGAGTFSLIAGFVLCGLHALGGVAYLVLPALYPGASSPRDGLAGDQAEAGDAWTYHSAKHGFQVKLPSQDWKEVEKEDAAVAFYDRRHSALLALQVQRATREETFRAAVEDMRTNVDRFRHQYLNEPEWTSGHNAAGYPYEYVHVATNASEGKRVLFANSWIWCQDKGVAYKVVFEGELKTMSDLGHDLAEEYFKRVAKGVVQSIE
jgi:hypothetical protein